jgi:hypothetical protein
VSSRLRKLNRQELLRDGLHRCRVNARLRSTRARRSRCSERLRIRRRSQRRAECWTSSWTTTVSTTSMATSAFVPKEDCAENSHSLETWHCRSQRCGATSVGEGRVRRLVDDRMASRSRRVPRLHQEARPFVRDESTACHEQRDRWSEVRAASTYMKPPGTLRPRLTGRTQAHPSSRESPVLGRVFRTFAGCDAGRPSGSAPDPAGSAGRASTTSYKRPSVDGGYTARPVGQRRRCRDARSGLSHLHRSANPRRRP